VGAQDIEQLGAREGAGEKDQGEREGLPLPGRDLFRHFPKLMCEVRKKIWPLSTIAANFFKAADATLFNSAL
jgi:hypothetical protein